MASHAEAPVLEVVHGTARVLTLNRPEKMNALNAPLLTRLAGRLRAIEADESVRAVILTGAGRAFSAGGDRSLLEGHLAGDMPDANAVTNAYMDITSCIPRLDVPVIAAVNGPALGIAVEFVALCDLVVMGADAYLCENHARFGMGTSPGIVRTWPRAASSVVAAELLMMARKVSAEDAVRLGLANRVVPAGEEVKVALELADEIAALPRSGPAAMKRALRGDVPAATPEPNA